MFKISKEFAFSASHQLEGLDEEHPCSRLHGHNYVIRLALWGQLGRVGFVHDYRDLGPFKTWLDDTLDHRHLNHIMHGNPTAERMSQWLAEKALEVLDLPENVYRLSVAVSETPKTWAEYELVPVLHREDGRKRWGHPSSVEHKHGGAAGE